MPRKGHIPRQRSPGRPSKGPRTIFTARLGPDATAILHALVAANPGMTPGEVIEEMLLGWGEAPEAGSGDPLLQSAGN